LLFAERGDGQNEEDRDSEEVRVADNSANGAIVSQGTQKAECQFHEAEQGEIICHGGEKIADGEYAGGGLVQRTRLGVELFYDDIYDRGGFTEDDVAGHGTKCQLCTGAILSHVGFSIQKEERNGAFKPEEW